MSGKHYDAGFYSDREGTLKSAEILAPMIEKAVAPKSIVDIGCGLGEFLAAFNTLGITDVLGIDGPWVNKESLKINPANFETGDLEKPIKKQRKYDLVISSEVAEHIHEHASDTFVASLASLGDVVVFSAAIPLQGGTYHVNEQWPQYWAEKFAVHDFVGIDYLRPKIWTNPGIKFWYKQNLLVFVKKETLDNYPLLKAEYVENGELLPLVHPVIFSFYASSYRKMTGWVPKWMKFIIRKFR